MTVTSFPASPAGVAIGALLAGGPLIAAPGDGKPKVYPEFNYGQNTGGEDWVQAIHVSEPAYRSEIDGEITVRFTAAGMTRASAFCWQQPTSAAPDPWGHDENLAPDGIALDGAGNGSFVFPAGKFPAGPINMRIFATDAAGKKDIGELQLFNRGGVKWKQGIPAEIPAPATGMQLVFADDFDKPLSISNDGRGATYNAHKPRFGDFSGWQFSNVLGDGKPFSQTGTWLKISARKDAQSPNGRSGLIASVDMDGKGIWAKPPCYLECRFSAQSAIGTWPAFWTITHLDQDTHGDELDIVEAYGGMGKGNPNHPGYSMVGHFWGQENTDGTKKDHPHSVARIMELGGKSYWSTTFHTYGCLIGAEDTVYYFDDIEVFRHPTGEVSKKFPHAFLINYAIGGISGWKIDLGRYGEGTDMWVDYVRVFAKEAVPDYVMHTPGSVPDLETAGIGLNFAVKGDAGTELLPAEIAGASGASQANWNNLPAANGTLDSAKDDSGKQTTLAVKWSVPGDDNAWRSKRAREWGFKGANLKMQQGYIELRGEARLSKIPYVKYDVYVYLGAGENTGSGKVSLATGNAAESATTYFFKLGWLEGKFKTASATTFETAQNSNLVIFRDQTVNACALSWQGDLNGGWTGVTAIQVVGKP